MAQGSTVVRNNLIKIGGTTVDTNSGVKSAGTQRMVIATDQPAFTTAGLISVKIDQTTPGTTNLVALSAETTKVIGTVRTADGSGNLYTTNSTTFTAKFAQDSNLLGTLGTAFTTAGKVDIKGADGDVFVRQTTAANLNATVVGTGTFAVQVASATLPVVTMNSASANSGVNSALAAVFDDVAPTSITENSFGFLRMSANRNAYSTIRDAAGNERGVNVTAANELLVSVNNATLAVTQSGTWNIGTVTTVTTVSTLTSITNTVNVAGTKTNNNAAPGATNVGALVAVANAAGQTWTEGNMVALSVDLSGRARTDVSSWFGSTAPSVGSKTSANSIPVVIASDQGAVTVAGAKTNNNAAPGATNIGALIGIANATIPAWTEGNQVAASMDLSGNTRVVQPDLIVAATAITTANLNLNSGTATTNSTVASGTLNGVSTGTFQVTGTYQGLLVPQVTVDGTNWVTTTGIDQIGTATNPTALSSGQTGIFQIDLSGFTKWRVTAAQFTSGTANVTLQASVGTGIMQIADAVQLDSRTAPAVSTRNSTVEAQVTNPSLTLVLEQIRDQNQAVLDALGIVGGNANAIRQLDQAGRERMTAPADSLTYQTTLTSTTAETTIIPAYPGLRTVMVGIMVSNTSTATSSQVDVRDGSGVADPGGLQTFQTVGGSQNQGWMGGGLIRVPQRVAGQPWTAKCGTSTASIIITAYYQLI